MPEPEKVGIPRARDAKGELYDRAAIDDSPRRFTEPLHCGGCTAPVGPVSDSKRNRDSPNPIPVKAHYRLKSRAKHDHDHDCAFRFDERAGDLVTEYRTEIDRDADTFVLVLRDPRSVAQPGEDPETGLDGRQVRTNVEASGGTALHPTIQAARAIARLLRSFEHDPTAAERFEATYQGQRIRWSDFFFDVEQDAARLAARLTAKEQYPIAVLGRARQIQPFKNGGGRSVYLYTPLGVKAPDPDGRWVNAVLRASQERFLGYEVDDVILGYGHWELYPRPEEAKSRRVDARLWCDSGSATVKFT